MKTTMITCMAFIILALLFPVTVAQAHTDNSEGQSKITADSEKIQIELWLDALELGRVVDMGFRPELAPGDMELLMNKNRNPLADYLLSHLEVSADGILTEGTLTNIAVQPYGELNYARLNLEFPVRDAVYKELRFQYNIFFDDNDRLHRNIANYEWEGQSGQFIFTSARRDLEAGTGTLLGQALNFIQLGFHHIMIGADHILFVIALLLGSRNLANVFKMATVFTLAHSVTLGLTALHVVSLSPDIVEPLIALSIVYVALEYVFFPEGRFRLWIVFMFGLVHGIGFAGALRMTGDINVKALLSILSFNLGVEGGQLLIILLLFPLLLYLRRFRWNVWVQGTATSVIGLIGFIWYMQRFLG